MVKKRKVTATFETQPMITSTLDNDDFFVLASMDLSAALDVVYFNQEKGALHAVRWSK